ncbi:hypothetical protein B0H66DRAFT_624269 [Apodospora peruviana]|uniref:Uncharacterized protein n=1 Tax=Apodospora peruviana TaxID=516989 RepID=A0AAE0M4Z4_9PEZI|nr:hypothetical protein B0H66DRAFT_624269 [Apodospora peruviana]
MNCEAIGWPVKKKFHSVPWLGMHNARWCYSRLASKAPTKANKANPDLNLICLAIFGGCLLSRLLHLPYFFQPENPSSGRENPSRAGRAAANSIPKWAGWHATLHNTTLGFCLKAAQTRSAAHSSSLFVFFESKPYYLHEAASQADPSVEHLFSPLSHRSALPSCRDL